MTRRHSPLSRLSSTVACVWLGLLIAAPAPAQATNVSPGINRSDENPEDTAGQQLAARRWGGSADPRQHTRHAVAREN